MNKSYYTEIQKMFFFRLSQKGFGIVGCKEIFNQPCNCYEWAIELKGKRAQRTIVVKVYKSARMNSNNYTHYLDYNFIDDLSQRLVNMAIIQYFKKIAFKRKLLTEKIKTIK